MASTMGLGKAFDDRGVAVSSALQQPKIRIRRIHSMAIAL